MVLTSASTALYSTPLDARAGQRGELAKAVAGDDATIGHSISDLGSGEERPTALDDDLTSQACT